MTIKKLRLFIGLPSTQQSHVLHIKSTPTALKSTKNYINSKYDWNVVYYYDVHGDSRTPIAKFKKGDNLPESLADIK